MCRCLGHLVSIWVDTGGQALLLSFMTPQVALPTLLFLSETGSLLSLEFAG